MRGVIAGSKREYAQDDGIRWRLGAGGGAAVMHH